MTAKITAKDLADQLNIDAKALRVYLRANAVAKDEETGRYAFTAAQAKKHLKDYPAWASHRAEAREAAAKAKLVAELEKAPARKTLVSEMKRIPTDDE